MGCGCLLVFWGRNIKRKNAWSYVNKLLCLQMADFMHFKKNTSYKVYIFSRISFHQVCCFPEIEGGRDELCPKKKEVIDFLRVGYIRKYSGPQRGKRTHWSYLLIWKVLLFKARWLIKQIYWVTNFKAWKSKIWGITFYKAFLPEAQHGRSHWTVSDSHRERVIHCCNKTPSVMTVFIAHRGRDPMA